MSKSETIERLSELAYQHRIKLIELCKSYGGIVHVSGDLSASEVLIALYHYGMNVDPNNIEAPDRDRFILSKGHAAVGMYIAMALRGFFDMDDIFATYGKLDTAYGMHPCKVHLPGVESSTGSLGHGLPIALGMALMARQKNEKYRVFTLLGDGETGEGTTWESAMVASSYKLGNLIAIVDRNRQFMTSFSDSGFVHLEPYAEKWRSFGWNVIETAGNDMSAVVDAIDAIPSSDSDKPTVLLCETIKGKGVSFMERNVSWHSGILTDEQAEVALKDLEMAYCGGQK